MNEYIIVNKTAIQKRIEELRQVCNKELGYASDKIYFELEHLLSQSTPLIPEIEKAYNIGQNKGAYHMKRQLKTGELTFSKVENYIANLKLDI